MQTKVCPACQKEKETFHEHHIIPRMYGGQKGPTISICIDCHKAVHRCASKAGPEPTDTTLIKTLARYILLSAKYTASSKNKPLTKHIRFTGQVARQLRVLAKDMNKPTSQIIFLAIQVLFQARYSAKGLISGSKPTTEN